MQSFLANYYTEKLAEELLPVILCNLGHLRIIRLKPDVNETWQGQIEPVLSVWRIF